MEVKLSSNECGLPACRNVVDTARTKKKVCIMDIEVKISYAAKIEI